jgi:hypothetical protein
MPHLAINVGFNGDNEQKGRKALRHGKCRRYPAVADGRRFYFSIKEDVLLW